MSREKLLYYFRLMVMPAPDMLQAIVAMLRATYSMQQAACTGSSQLTIKPNGHSNHQEMMSPSEALWSQRNQKLKKPRSWSCCDLSPSLMDSACFVLHTMMDATLADFDARLMLTAHARSMAPVQSALLQHMMCSNQDLFTRAYPGHRSL